VSDGLRLWLRSSYQPRQQSQWLDSRDRPISNVVRTARVLAAAPAGLQNTTLPATLPNTLPSHDVAEATGATQSKPSNRTDFEGYNLAAGLEDFKSSLLDYGRSIMISAVNDDCDSQTLVNDMNATKENVIAQHTVVCQHLEELSHSLDVKDVEASKLRAEISELEGANAAMEEEKSYVIQATEVELKMMTKTADNHCAEKEKYQKLWEEAEQGRREAETELAGIKQDHKRKRERMEKMWRNVEREVKQ